MAAKWKNFTEQELQIQANKVYSNSNFLSLLGYSKSCGSATQTMNNIKEKYPNLDFSHFKGKVWNKGLSKETDERVKKHSIKLRTLTNEEVFCKNSNVQNKAVRIRLREVIPYQCDFCGMNGQWLNTEIILEIDHINGINTDNRISNLRFLCPNCHATTNTYKGRNKN